MVRFEACLLDHGNTLVAVSVLATLLLLGSPPQAVEQRRTRIRSIWREGGAGPPGWVSIATALTSWLKPGTGSSSGSFGDPGSLKRPAQVPSTMFSIDVPSMEKSSETIEASTGLACRFDALFREVLRCLKRLERGRAFAGKPAGLRHSGLAGPFFHVKWTYVPQNSSPSRR